MPDFAIPPEWLPTIPPEPPVRPKRAMTADEEQVRLALLVGMGVVGGAAVAWWGVEHMFVTGLEDKERRMMMLLGAGVAGVYGLFYLADLDKRWLNVEGAVEAASEYVPKNWYQGGTK